ncbi:hypothetical protein HALLA_00195 (plasmid) [Halostagnicola larsenii XH-48]|uniref:DUF4352 domain-containing protein n=1 Tax=Halostagnicola larsenii XH-48 TaxID=797299 RepID=W0JXH6_9EURY|nr:hypothetical protein HALLA_00195 [Halostagnicola larsenii XH-48]
MTTATDDKITINKIHIQDSCKNIDRWGAEVATYEPENEDEFVIVELTCGNTGNTIQHLPDADEFFVKGEDGELYDLAIDPIMEKPDFRGEFENQEIYSSERVPPNSTVSGILIFEIPSNQEIQAGLESSYDDSEYIIYWK